MRNLGRRSFLKALGTLPWGTALTWASLSPLLYSTRAKANAEANEDNSPATYPSALEITRSRRFAPGYLSIIQGPTSDSSTLINIFTPRLKNHTYEAYDARGNALPVELYERVRGPGFFHIDKIQVSSLMPGQTYRLDVKDSRTIVDSRNFRVLSIRGREAKFGFVACMCDDYRFETVIDPMWQRLEASQPDFLILNGDLVYVDSFAFVARNAASELDLWQRYQDAFARIPLYRWQNLVPIFATWDDHDFGTNDGDRGFTIRAEVARLFRAAFGGRPLANTWTPSPHGVGGLFRGFGQTFALLDNRSFRQPNNNQSEAEAYGHWGEAQHRWLIDELRREAKPAWLINGNQFFNGINLSFKESFEGNHAPEFATLLSDLSALPNPVVFGSGDIHLSEIMRIPRERIGYETYEFTSSSMHSYAGEGWENPLRISDAYCKEFNFLLVRSVAETEGLMIDTECLGLAPTPYFSKRLRVSRR